MPKLCEFLHDSCNKPLKLGFFPAIISFPELVFFLLDWSVKRLWVPICHRVQRFVSLSPCRFIFTSAKFYVSNCTACLTFAQERLIWGFDMSCYISVFSISSSMLKFLT